MNLEESYAEFKAEEERQRVLKALAEKESEPSEPVKIETEGVFDPSLLDSAGYPLPVEALMGEEFFDNPMGPLMKMLGTYLDSIRPRAFEPMPVKSEHKVRIFRLNDRTSLGVVEREIEDLLNDGYCCHMPTVIGDYVIMDFSRRKETEENEREQ